MRMHLQHDSETAMQLAAAETMLNQTSVKMLQNLTWKTMAQVEQCQV